MNKGKKASYNRGKAAERHAALWLRLKGYRILETRFKTPLGEVDLIAFKNDHLIAIEVKARATEEAAYHAIHEKQWQRIARSLLWYQKQHRKYQSCPLRFDAIFILPLKKIKHVIPIHIQNAWQSQNSF